MPAKVYLIGAGPGDPELITVKGVRCIREADVVIYDYLANQALLSYVREDATLVFVGKKGFSKHVTQEQINACLVAEALGGAEDAKGSDRVVARLKGGDPFVFGRGGEEALALSEAGIPYEVVPGVTSGIAAPAYAGIPVTHRRVASSVAFITGNEDPTKPETAIDWPGLAHGADTLCFYMGVRNLPSISEKLRDAGRPASTPVALVRWGTTPHQELLIGTLGDIAKKAADAGFQAPAIIVVGDVVSLHGELDWLSPRPLAGHTIAVTRARTQASDLVASLRHAGAEVVECPTIRVEALDDYGPLERALNELGTYGWVVFTSVNGVSSFFEHLGHLGMDARSLARSKVAAIGSATAEALRKRGIAPDLVPSCYRAEAIAEALLDADVGAGTRVLIARAEKARDVLPDKLKEAGAQVDVVAVYRTVPADDAFSAQALQRIVAGDVDMVTFTSSSTVTNLVHLLDGALNEARRDVRASTDAACSEADSSKLSARDILSKVACCSIGPITTRTLEKEGLQPAVEADPYTIPALVAAIIDHAKHHAPDA